MYQPFFKLASFQFNTFEQIFVTRQAYDDDDIDVHIYIKISFFVF